MGYIPLEETGTIKLNDTKTKPDETIPKEIDTESLSSCDTEETSKITLNTEQLKEDNELRIYRTQYLERIFHKKAQLKINELIKLNESHQRPICDVKFDGTQTTLNYFWINLKMTAKSRGWTKFTKAFIVRSNNIARTVCVLENPSAMNNTEYRIWMKEREDHDYFSNERTNMYTAILNSITQTVRNRLNATAHDIKMEWS